MTPLKLSDERLRHRGARAVSSQVLFDVMLMVAE
jgi:hypothetical protein